MATDMPHSQSYLEDCLGAYYGLLFSASLSVLSFVLFLFCVVLNETGCSLDCDNLLQYSYLKNPMPGGTASSPSHTPTAFLTMDSIFGGKGSGGCVMRRVAS